MLDGICWVSVLVCLGLSGCITTAPERAMPPLLADPEPQIYLAWTPPTTMTDGTPAVEIAGYTLYYGLASRQYSVRKTLGPQTTYGLGGLVPERTYYVAVTAYDRTGRESGLSEEITIVVPPRAPAPGPH
jgi:fibronectin type III domain protein